MRVKARVCVFIHLLCNGPFWGLPNGLPDGGMHDMPKHVGDLLTLMHIHFGAIKVGFIN